MQEEAGSARQAWCAMTTMCISPRQDISLSLSLTLSLSHSLTLTLSLSLSLSLACSHPRLVQIPNLATGFTSVISLATPHPASTGIMAADAGVEPREIGRNSWGRRLLLEICPVRGPIPLALSDQDSISARSSSSRGRMGRHPNPAKASSRAQIIRQP